MSARVASDDLCRLNRWESRESDRYRAISAYALEPGADKLEEECRSSTWPVGVNVLQVPVSSLRRRVLITLPEIGTP
jgi:hypothetical protein